MSNLSYGGINLQGIKTRRFEITPVYNDDGIDSPYQKLSIEVDCIFNPGMTSYPDVGELPGATMVWVKQTLMTPRNQLTFDNGVRVITSPPTGVPIDIDWGPFPQYCHVQAMNGQMTWMVSYGIDTYINDCNRSHAPILSNRWGQTWDTDEHMRTRITTTGKCRLAADVMALNNVNPHTLVTSIIPYILPHFRRDRVSISLDPKGTTIDYSVEDIEMYYSLGTLADANSVASKYGVTSFEIGYTQTTAQKTDTMVFPTIRCTLDGVVYGHAYTSASRLTAFVLDLMIEKLYTQATDVGAKPPIMCDFNIRQLLNAPEVHFSVSTFNSPGREAPAPIINVMFHDAIELLPNTGYNPQLHWGGMIQYQDPTYTAYLQNLMGACIEPCNLAIPYGAFQSTTLCDGPVSYGYIVTSGTRVFTPTNYNQPSQSYYTADHYRSIYGKYDVKGRYETNYNMLMAPTTQSTQELRPTQTSYNAPLPWYSDQTFANRNYSSVVAVGNPTATLTYTWSAERMGLPPLIPHPKVNSQNMVLMHSVVEPMSPQLGPDGATLLWRVDGIYTYALLKPLIAGDDLWTAINPYINLTFNDTTIPGPNTQGGAELNFIVGGIIDDKNLDGGYVQNS